MLCADKLRLEVPGRILCRRLDLALKPGQCWAILGKNGSGKTTLLQALSGLSHSSGGAISLDGQPVGAFSRQQLALRMGVLLQEESPVFFGSVLDFVLLGRFPHGNDGAVELARHALEQTGMAQAQGQLFSTLSGGERQRARIAQLLAQAPDIYFLDEPLQHLDLPHQIAVMHLFQGLAHEHGRTVVMVLHDISWAGRYCDHAILIHDDGHIAHGKSADLITTTNMERLYQCRFQHIKTSDGNYFLPTLELVDKNSPSGAS